MCGLTSRLSWSASVAGGVPSWAFTTQALDLRIAVGNGDFLANKQRIQAVPYSVKADYAATADHAKTATLADNGVPPGTVVAYWGTTPPEGWLMADGSPVPEGDEYSALSALVGANVPDLRGMFLRGKNNDRSDEWKDPDGGRELGSYQASANKAHHHTVAVRQNSVGMVDWEPARGHFGTASSVSTSSSGGDESRPNNTAVNYIIKI